MHIQYYIAVSFLVLSDPNGFLYKVQCTKLDVCCGSIMMRRYLKDICVIETDLKNIMLIAEALTTVNFNKHLNTYEVINTADLIFVQQDELLYPLPLHIITATNQEHVKLLYVQSIMFPILKRLIHMYHNFN